MTTPWALFEMVNDPINVPSSEFIDERTAWLGFGIELT